MCHQWLQNGEAQFTNLFLLLSCSSFPLTSCPTSRLEGLSAASFVITLHCHSSFLFIAISITWLANIQRTPASLFHLSQGSSLRRLQVDTVRLPVRVLCRLTIYTATNKRLSDIHSVLWHCWLGGRKGIHPLKKWGNDGGGHWLVCTEWHPAGWLVHLPLLIFPCTIKSKSSVWHRLTQVVPEKKGRKTVVVCGGHSVWNTLPAAYKHDQLSTH